MTSKTDSVKQSFENIIDGDVEWYIVIGYIFLILIDIFSFLINQTLGEVILIAIMLLLIIHSLLYLSVYFLKFIDTIFKASFKEYVIILFWIVFTFIFIICWILINKYIFG